MPFLGDEAPVLLPQPLAPPHDHLLALPDEAQLPQPVHEPQRWGVRLHLL